MFVFSKALKGHFCIDIDEGADVGIKISRNVLME